MNAPPSSASPPRPADSAGEALAALSLGANQGDIEGALRSACERLAAVLDGARVSALYRSAPVGGPPQPDFTNLALVGRTRLSPEDLLAVAKALERQAGRRRGPRFGPRPLDVDLLLHGDHRRRHPELELPHPQLRRRRFYLEPLASLVPELPVPPDGATVAELLERLAGETPLVARPWDRPPDLR